MISVKNLVGKSGIALANEFVITKNGVVFFQSYETVIGKYKDRMLYLNKNYLGTNFDGSKATIRNLYIFIRKHTHLYAYSRQEVLDCISDGRIKLISDRFLKY